MERINNFEDRVDDGAEQPADAIPENGERSSVEWGKANDEEKRLLDLAFGIRPRSDETANPTATRADKLKKTRASKERAVDDRHEESEKERLPKRILRKLGELGLKIANLGTYTKEQEEEALAKYREEKDAAYVADETRIAEQMAPTVMESDENLDDQWDVASSFVDNNGERVYLDKHNREIFFKDGEENVFVSEGAKRRWEAMSDDDHAEWAGKHLELSDELMTPEEKQAWEEAVAKNEIDAKTRKIIAGTARALIALTGILVASGVVGAIIDASANHNVDQFGGGWGPRPIDTDGDGIADAYDYDGDGLPDVLCDLNGDNTPDGVDVNGDGIPDFDMFGHPVTQMGEFFLVDVDGDGTFDNDILGRQIMSVEIGGHTTWLIDIDGDGIPDMDQDMNTVYAVDVDGDGIMDGLSMVDGGRPELNMDGTPMTNTQYDELVLRGIEQLPDGSGYNIYSEGGYKLDEDAFFSGDKQHAGNWGAPLAGETQQEKLDDLLVRWSNQPAQAINAAREMGYDKLPDWVNSISGDNQFADQLKADPAAYDDFMNNFLNWVKSEVSDLSETNMTGHYASTFAYLDGAGNVRIGYDGDVNYTNRGGTILNMWRGVDEDGDGTIDHYELFFQAREECGGNNPDVIGKITIPVPEVEKGEKPESGDKPETGEKPEVGEKPEIGEKPEQGEKPEIGEKPEQGEKPESGEKFETGEKPERGEKPEYGEKPEVGEKPERGEKPESGDKPETGEKPEVGEKPEIGEKPESGDSGLKGKTGDFGGGDGEFTLEDTEDLPENAVLSDASNHIDTTEEAGGSVKDADGDIYAGDSNLGTGEADTKFSEDTSGAGTGVEVAGGAAEGTPSASDSATNDSQPPAVDGSSSQGPGLGAFGI